MKTAPVPYSQEYILSFLTEGGRGTLDAGRFPSVLAEVVWEGEWQSAQQGCRRCL